MKERIANLMSLPYRLWMLALGSYIVCDGCHSIVSGGFGYFDNGVHVFHCMDCTKKSVAERKAEENLRIASSYDPSQEERK